MTYAVTGSTGQLGRLVIEALKSRTETDRIVALARDTEKAADLGVEARLFDYDKPETLAPALDGVDTLLLISGSDIGQRGRQHAAVIDAAKAAGVAHIVYTSLLNAPDNPIMLAQEHLETEKLLAESGVAHTLLRNGWYTENYLMSVPSAVEHGAMIGSAGDGRISSAARADFAEAAAVVLTDPSLQGEVYELAGDDSYTLADMAEAVSQASGKEIPYVDMPEADYAAALTQAGLPEDMAAFLAHCDAQAAKGALAHEGQALSRLIGRPTTPMPTLVAATVAG
ncbi:NAD(P)H-binding protein [Rhodobacterales bacterium HKCCE4037]|nr:NAD(P)H-binding protein [Rhodobacterales bacterium HKCCE4037]